MQDKKTISPNEASLESPKLGKSKEKKHSKLPLLLILFFVVLIIAGVAWYVVTVKKNDEDLADEHTNVVTQGHEEEKDTEDTDDEESYQENNTVDHELKDEEYTDNQESKSVCISEGEILTVSQDSLNCCTGLTAISCDELDSEGVCTVDCAGASYCTKCGNGVCGVGENECNCPQDCDTSEVCNGISFIEAQSIAKYKSDCSEYGDFEFSNDLTNICNLNSETWQFGLINVTKEHCDASCIVNTNTKEAYINWMCTEPSLGE